MKVTTHCDHRSKFSNFNPVEALIFFRPLPSNCLKLENLLR